MVHAKQIRSADTLFLCGLAAVLAVTAATYWPGIAGGFLFDDYPNLRELERIPLYRDFWDGVVAYLNSGFSGPTKRPVAMASFLLEYPSWPFDPAPFKRNNILLHLIAVLLVTWLALLVGLRAGMSRPAQVAFAWGVAAVFALHPLHVSTTLYVIQRMTILSAIFSVAALICYLKAADAIVRGQVSGWILLFLLYPLMVMAAIFSKETGILVAFFAAIIAFSLPLKWRVDAGPVRRWTLWAITYGPMLIVLIAMIWHFAQIMRTDPDLARREFTVIERLLTQPRVLYSYLYDLFIPKIQSSGLYHDNFKISRSLFEPVMTLIAAGSLAAGAIVALMKARTIPFLCIAVVGYLAGHALESSYIGLELYFEHRNYMPSIFLFMGIVAGLMWLVRGFRTAGALVACLLAGWLIFATWQQVQLWSNPVLQSLVWAKDSQGSERSLLDAANHLQRIGAIEQAIALTEEAIEKNPESGRAVLYGLALKCRYGGDIESANVDRVVTLLKRQVYHQATYNYLKSILRGNERHRCPGLSTADLRRLIDATFSPKNIHSGNIKALRYFELGNLEILNGSGSSAVGFYEQALALRGDVKVGIIEVARLASAGYLELALEHLQRVRIHNEARFDPGLSMVANQDYNWVKQELSRLEALLQEEINVPVHN